MELSNRQKEIIDIIKNNQPIRSMNLAEKLGVSQATVRVDLALLSSLGLVEGKPNQGYTINPSGSNANYIGRDEKVSSIMRPGVVVFETESVYDAAVQMILKDVSALFVLNKENNLVGILSRKDLLKSAIQGSDPRTIPCGLIMTRQPLHKVVEEDFVYEASKIMVEKQIDCLPVVRNENGNDVLVGRITKTNISEMYVKLFER